MTDKIALQMAADALVIQDAAGDQYVLTADALARSRATDEQRAALAHADVDSGSHGIIVNQLRDRLPFQVVGVVALPTSRRENPFWPGVFE